MASLLNLRERVHRDVIPLITRYLSRDDVECCFMAHGCALRDVYDFGRWVIQNEHMERFLWLQERYAFECRIFEPAWFRHAVCSDSMDGLKFFAAKGYCIAMSDILAAVEGRAIRVLVEVVTACPEVASNWKFRRLVENSYFPELKQFLRQNALYY